VEFVFLRERLEEALVGFGLDLLMNLTLVARTTSSLDLLKVFVAQHTTVSVLQQRAHRPIEHAAVAMVPNPTVEVPVLWTKTPVLGLDHDVGPAHRRTT
jgi:hypothetical protein